MQPRSWMIPLIRRLSIACLGLATTSLAQIQDDSAVKLRNHVTSYEQHRQAVASGTILNLLEFAEKGQPGQVSKSYQAAQEIAKRDGVLLQDLVPEEVLRVAREAAAEDEFSSRLRKARLLSQSHSPDIQKIQYNIMRAASAVAYLPESVRGKISASFFDTLTRLIGNPVLIKKTLGIDQARWNRIERSKGRELWTIMHETRADSNRLQPFEVFLLSMTVVTAPEHRDYKLLTDIVLNEYLQSYRKQLEAIRRNPKNLTIDSFLNISEQGVSLNSQYWLDT